MCMHSGRQADKHVASVAAKLLEQVIPVFSFSLKSFGLGLQASSEIKFVSTLLLLLLLAFFFFLPVTSILSNDVCSCRECTPDVMCEAC